MIDISKCLSDLMWLIIGGNGGLIAYTFRRLFTLKKKIEDSVSKDEMEIYVKSYVTDQLVKHLPPIDIKLDLIQDTLVKLSRN